MATNPFRTNPIRPLPLGDGLRARLFRLLWARRFGTFGSNTRVIAPVAIEGAAAIHLGDNVVVAAGTCLAATPLTGSLSCRLEIGDGCAIGRFNHIYATRSIRFGRKVLTANGVYVSDNVHGYRDPARAVLDQGVVQLRDVVIGDGSWLGHNVCVIGASIGRNCVIGANAVVTRDIPDYSVAVGAPAYVIRRFVPGTGEWERVTSGMPEKAG